MSKEANGFPNESLCVINLEEDCEPISSGSSESSSSLEAKSAKFNRITVKNFVHFTPNIAVPKDLNDKPLDLEKIRDLIISSMPALVKSIEECIQRATKNLVLNQSKDAPARSQHLNYRKAVKSNSNHHCCRTVVQEKPLHTCCNNEASKTKSEVVTLQAHIKVCIAHLRDLYDALSELDTNHSDSEVSVLVNFDEESSSIGYRSLSKAKCLNDINGQLSDERSERERSYCDFLLNLLRGLEKAATCSPSSNLKSEPSAKKKKKKGVSKEPQSRSNSSMPKENGTVVSEVNSESNSTLNVEIETAEKKEAIKNSKFDEMVRLLYESTAQELWKMLFNEMDNEDPDELVKTSTTPSDVSSNPSDQSDCVCKCDV